MKKGIIILALFLLLFVVGGFIWVSGAWADILKPNVPDVPDIPGQSTVAGEVEGVDLDKTIINF